MTSLWRYHRSDLKIGDTPVWVIAPDIRVHQNTRNPALQLVSKNVSYDQLQYRLERISLSRFGRATSQLVQQLTSNSRVVLYGMTVLETASCNRCVRVNYRPVGRADGHECPQANFAGWRQCRTCSVEYGLCKRSTEWMETTFNGGSNKWQDVEIRFNGSYLGRMFYGIGGTPSELNIGGVQYRRGGARDNAQINSKGAMLNMSFNGRRRFVRVDCTIGGDRATDNLCCSYSIPLCWRFEIMVVSQETTFRIQTRSTMKPS